MVADPREARVRLGGAGALPGFHGIMSDVRFDRNGELVGRDEVLRLRSLRHDDGSVESLLGWKGPTGVSPEGYKTRRELEYVVAGGNSDPRALLEVLGYRQVYAIDRYVEYHHLGSAVVRLEWYPKMDVLVEVEGDPRGIEAGLAALGLPRSAYTAEPLVVFAGRYAARTGHPAILSLAELAGEAPSWVSR